MTLLRFLGFANILEYNLRKINATFPIKQNILLVYVIISLGNFYLFKSHAWIKYMFCMENEFENVYGKIESYGDILLYFCEIGNMKKYFTLIYMAPINEYKLDKYDPSQWA